MDPTLPTAEVCGSAGRAANLCTAAVTPTTGVCRVELLGSKPQVSPVFTHPPVKALRKKTAHLSEGLNLGMFSTVILNPQPPNSEVQCSGEDITEALAVLQCGLKACFLKLGRRISL